MTFYKQLSRYYDEIFAVTAAEMDFIKQQLSGCGQILDIGCGTGNKTELLTAPDRKITGLDLDPAMIEKARKLHGHPSIEYQVGNMTAIGREFRGRLFDGVVCLGNTLVHLTDDSDLSAFFESVAEIISPDGRLIIQILNYDHIMADNISELPLIETDHVVFRRFYQWIEGRLRFAARLEVKGGDAFEDAVFLRPIKREDLDARLADAFKAVKYYGGYDGRPWAEDSFVCLAVADRR